MPLYVIERSFADRLELTNDDVRLIDDINADEGVSWLFSFVSADKLADDLESQEENQPVLSADELNLLTETYYGDVEFRAR